MDIFVEQDGQRLGPYDITQLGESLTANQISAESRAWIDGQLLSSTVSGLLAQAAPTPSPPPVPAAAQQTYRRTKSQRRSYPQSPGIAPVAEVPRQASNKLRPQSELPPIASGEPSAKFRPGRRARITEALKPTPLERLRFFGAATPILIAIVLLAPWISGTFLAGDMPISGYKTLDKLSDLKGYHNLFIGTFAIAALGVGLFSFKGGLDGGSISTLPTFACACLALGSIFLLHNALPDASRTVLHHGGPWYTYATLIVGTAFGLIPGQDASPSASVYNWIIVGVLGLSGLVTFLIGTGMGGRA